MGMVPHVSAPVRRAVEPELSVRQRRTDVTRPLFAILISDPAELRSE
jgi:hypothetical protein